MGIATAQNVGIGTTTFTPNDDALLELRSTTSGFLLPKMTEVQKNAIVGPTEGLIVYQTNATKGFKYYNGSAWTEFGGAADNFGSHEAEMNISLEDNWLSNDGGNEGIRIADNGYVGIGSSSPSQMLQVQVSNNGLNLPLFLRNTNGASGTGNGIGVGFNSEQNGDWIKAAIFHERISNYGVGKLHFLINEQGNSQSVTLADAKMSILPNGNVGIGTTDPAKKLQVVSSTSNANVITVQSSASNGWSSIDFLNQSGSTSATFGFANSGTSGIFTGRAYMNSYNNDFVLTRNSSENSIFISGSTGNIGIGTAHPYAKLHVDGSARINGLAGSGTRMVVADANGNLSTEEIPSGGGGSGSGWTLTGNTVTGGADAYFGTINNKPINIKINNQSSGILDKDGNVVIGYQANNDNNSANVGLGKSVTIYGNNHDNHVAIGSSAQIQAGNNTKSAIAIGNGANITGGSNHSYSIAVGNSAQVQAANGIAFGRNTNVNQQYGMALGDGAQSHGNSGVAIGQNTYTNGSGAVTIGKSSQAQASSAVALGESAYTNGSGAVTIGKSSQAQGSYAISIGQSSYTNSTDGIAIGRSSQAQGSNTIVIGYNVYNGNSNTASIGNSSITSVKLSGASSNSYALIVGTSSSNGNGAYLTKGGVWTNASDVNLKDDITAVDANEVLAKVVAMEVNKWKYIGTDEYHIGPMAQDFYAAFELGIDTNRISTIDPAGVALVSVKALNEKIEIQETRIAELIRANAALVARIEKLETQAE